MDGIVFGWSITGPPIVHHVGIILQWAGSKSIVVHYGAEARPIIIVETLERAALRTSRGKGIMVHFNPFHQANIPWDPIPSHILDVQDVDWESMESQFEPTPILLEYEESHSTYDVQNSNCQHFVAHFVGDIGLESDFYTHVPQIASRLAHLGTGGSEVKIIAYLLRVIEAYRYHRNSGICQWDHSLDLWIPPQDQRCPKLMDLRSSHS